MFGDSRVGRPVTFITPAPERNRQLRAEFTGPPELQEWVDLSHRLAPMEPLLIPTVQGLGFIDVQLRQANSRFSKDPSDFPDREKEMFAVDLMVWQTRSQLWVLGAYEVVRFVKANLGSLGQTRGTLEEWSRLKRQYERVRIPLAKFQRAGTAPDDDLGIAFPAIPGTRGAGWLLNERTVVWRDDLADELRAALRVLPDVRTL